MTDAALFFNWYVGLAIAAVVVSIAALLLVLVWQAANRILTLAVTALDLVKQIRDQTKIIWALENTNKIAMNVLADAKSIKTHGATVAQALHETESK